MGVLHDILAREAALQAERFDRLMAQLDELGRSIDKVSSCIHEEVHDLSIEIHARFDKASSRLHEEADDASVGLHARFDRLEALLKLRDDGEPG